MFCLGSQPTDFGKNQYPAFRIVYLRALQGTPTMQRLYVSLARQFADIGTCGAYLAPLCLQRNASVPCKRNYKLHAWCSDTLTSTHRYVTAEHGFSQNPNCLRHDRTFPVSDINICTETNREISWQIMAMRRITRNYL